MESTGTCPRGHAVAPDAVLCTVCWVRLDGEDPRSKRTRILNLVARPVTAVAVGAVVVAVGVGAALATTSMTEPPTVMADAATVAAPSTQPTPATQPTPSTQPSRSTANAPLVTSVPLAATVLDPLLTGSSGACMLKARDQVIDCRLEGDSVRFEACVPADSATVALRTRSSSDDPWQDVPTDVVLLPGGSCQTPQLRADVAVDAALFSVSDDRWRIVARDAAGEKLVSMKLKPATSQE